MRLHPFRLRKLYQMAETAVPRQAAACSIPRLKLVYAFPGPKSAQQIILDLKGKLVIDELELIPNQESDVSQALTALGYSKTEIKKVLKKVNPDQSVEMMIKDALKLLMK